MYNLRNSTNEIYLDACATSPTHIDVLNRIRQVEEDYWANPSSLHNYGLKAADTLERSRYEIAKHLSAKPKELIFTSGATESNHLAILGCSENMKPGRIVVSAVEHPAVISAAKKLTKYGWDIQLLEVDSQGMVDLNHLEGLVAFPTKILSIIWGQSEIGTIQPIIQIGNLCREKGVLFHTDATQILSQGLFSWNELPVDLLSASAHKFQGPKGVGFLLCRENILSLIQPLQRGGGQENTIRGGTEPIPLIAGMSKAIKIVNHNFSHNPGKDLTQYKVAKLTTRLRNELKHLDMIKFTGHPTRRLANHISMLVSSSNNVPLSGRAIVRELSKNGVYASSGSACSSGKIVDSDVLRAINIPPKWRQSGLRFSLGSWIDEQDIVHIPKILKKSLTNLSKI